MSGKITLLRILRPHNDESFPGFLLRLAEANGYERFSWILQMAGITHPVNYLPDPDPLKDRIDLSELSNITNVSAEDLGSLLFERHDGGRHFKQFEIFGQAVPRYMVRFSRTKVCPACLKEANYSRKIWDLAPVTVCPIHVALTVTTPDLPR